MTLIVAHAINLASADRPAQPEKQPDPPGLTMLTSWLTILSAAVDAGESCQACMLRKKKCKQQQKNKNTNIGKPEWKLLKMWSLKGAWVLLLFSVNTHYSRTRDVVPWAWRYEQGHDRQH